MCNDQGGVLEEMQDGERVLKLGRPLSVVRYSRGQYIKWLDGRERKKHCL